MTPACTVLPPDRSWDQISLSVIWWTKSCRVDRASIKSCADSRHLNGKNLPQHYRFDRPKFLPRRGTSLIVDPMFRAAESCAVGQFSRREKRPTCQDKNNRERAAIPPALPVPSASHEQDLAPF